MEIQWKNLIDRAKNNDQDAFSALYENSYDAVYRTVKSMVKDEDTAMDIVQDAFVSGFAKLDGFQTPENFIPWMRRIATNKALDWFRSKHKKHDIAFSQLADEEDNLPEFEDEKPAHSPEAVMDRSETTRLIEEILGTLSEEQRIAVGMYYYEEMPVAEIATALGVSENTIKSRLNYGRKKIKAGVEELEKKGTKLYSLAPIPFLIWLLRCQQSLPATDKAPLWLLEKILAQGAALAAAGSAGGANAAGAAATASKTGLLSTLGAKITAGVLAVALVGGVAAGISFANRGNPAPEPSQNQTETAPEKTAFPLAGTWKEIQRTEEEVNNYITIDEDGNATMSTGDELRFTTKPGESEWDEDLVIGWCEGKPVKFIRYGDSYVISVGNLGYGVRYYYREEEYADYDVVELTAENMTDYIEYYGYYTTPEDDGKTSVSYWEIPRFKAGLGPHSFVFGELTYTVYYEEVTVDPATYEVTVDETSKYYTSAPAYMWPTESVEFCGAGDYSGVYSTGNNINIEGTDPIEDHFQYHELTGAKEIVGKVYVPKGWTP